MERRRVDTLLAERGLSPSRTSAAASVRAGRVRVGTGGARASKPGQLIAADEQLLVEEPPPYVSRGGIKLENALSALAVDPAGRDCLDVGASTGGFTDCLLEHGAARVIALDVAQGQLDWGLRNDERVHVIERANARDLAPQDLPWAPSLATVDVSFISLRKVLPALVSCLAPGRRASRPGQAAVRARPGRVGRAASSVTPADRREALLAVAIGASASWASASAASRPPDCPGPKGNHETFIHCASRRRAGSPTSPGGRRWTRAWSPRRRAAVRTVALVTHTHPEQTDGRGSDRDRGRRRARRGQAPRDRRRGARSTATPPPGSKSWTSCPTTPTSASRSAATARILQALRRYADTGVPVFGVNFGTIGFLAAVERDQLEEGLRRAFAGEFETVALPGLVTPLEIERPVALNDISFIRKPHGRVAELSYSLGGQEIGHVRCDGLVAATPVGSTGYNLANQGPILAWGVEGFVVSFIAPHTLTARPLVVAPDDVLHVSNERGREPVDIAFDGAPGRRARQRRRDRVGFRDGAATLAQLPGSNFYRRMREKFGRLAG